VRTKFNHKHLIQCNW